ncbi:MAG: RNA 2'-phosphotransferase [Pseudomonadota bacterium]
MASAGDTRLSKFLSLVLRHEPEAADVALDPAGWVDVEALLTGARSAGVMMDSADLDRIVKGSDKQRFSLSPCRTRVRAAQGHSVQVDLGLVPETPADTLWHGTAEASLASILAQGLRSGARRHVHLSPDHATAHAVGSRHGKPVVLRVAAGEAHKDGQVFWRADNGVWLTGPLDPGYLKLQDSA